MNAILSRLLLVVFLTFAVIFSITFKTEAAGGGFSYGRLYNTNPPVCVCPSDAQSCWCLIL